MGIVLFIIIFCVVVIAHEFGHFIIAKMNGIHVVEFSVGMGPCIFSFTKGETKYAVRLLPLGGACMFEGEDGLNMAEDEDEEEDKAHPASEKVKKEEDKDLIEETQLGKRSGAFPDAPVFVRIATVVAGPVFNFILAFVFSAIIIGSYGADIPVIQQVAEDGAAYKAGLRDGDRIVKMNGDTIHLYREVSLCSMLNRGEDISVTYERQGKTYETVITPIYDEQAGRYYMGLYGAGVYKKFDFLGTLKYSAYEVGYWIETTFKSLQMLVQGQVSKDDVAGPVGMAQTVNDIYSQSKPDGAYYVWLNMLNFAILLSANLGVLNLLPFPALDGGRLVFLVIEVLRGKPVPPEKEGLVHMVGMILLMALMVFVLFNDLSRLF